jgi:hypothetical protein
MNTKSIRLIRKLLCGVVLVGMMLSLFSGISGASSVSAQENKYYQSRTITLRDGTSLDEIIINGPPVPPPGYELERAPVPLYKLNRASALTLPVPAFNWVFGCSAVSGAMIAGYYDRTGYPNIYTGPTNGGVIPMDSSTWGTWNDGYDTYPNNPLVASHNGVDGRVTRGSIDDYWISYGSTASDPYITGGWTQHTWVDAIGDYMKTSQSAWGNDDASTTFWNYSNNSGQLTCDYLVSIGYTEDGTLGRRQFYQARGYTVTTCYNQKTDNTITNGFSFAQYKAEIDAGRPVMLNLYTSPNGHTIVGVGYDTATNTAYVHDTWDYLTHSMTWGGSYSGMLLQSVSIVYPSVVTAVELKSFTAMVDKKPFTAYGKSVILSWETTSEVDNLGFNLYRATSIDGERTKVNAGLIPTLVYPGSPYGAVYSYTDTSLNNSTYYYWLEDMDINGRTGLTGPESLKLVAGKTK